MPTSFQTNLAYALHDRFGPGFRDKTLADALRVDRSTVSRLRTAAKPPGSGRLDSLARYFGIAPSAWCLPPAAFIAEYHSMSRPADTPAADQPIQVRLGAITAHRHQWSPSFDIHKGQYIAYWKAAGAPQLYVASLLTIEHLTNEGVGFTLVNPYLRDDVEQDDLRHWLYTGQLYPVADYLYLFGEQIHGSYEILTMILTASPVSPPDILRGCMTGIHVKDGHKQIAVNIAVILAHLRKPIIDWRREYGTRLGKLSSGKIPERIRKLLEPYPGVIGIS